MVTSEYDPEELVTWQGSGDMTLREAVTKFGALLPEERALVILYRDRGREPASFDAIDLAEMAQLPEFRE